MFRANPRTGKSFIVLTDVAYYLIFFAYILFTISFEPKGGWSDTVNAKQLQHETARLGGILLIIGILHGVMCLCLPGAMNVSAGVQRPVPHGARSGADGRLLMTT